MMPLRARVAQAALWPVEHPWVTLAITAALAVLAAVSASRIRPDVSLQAMFAGNDPSASALIHVLNDFPAADQLLVMASLPDSAPGPDPGRLTAFGKRFAEQVHSAPQTEKLTDGILYRTDREMSQFIEKVIGPSAMYYLDDGAFAAARQRLTGPQIRARIARDKAMLSVPGPAGQAFAKVMRADPLGLHDFILDRLAGERPFRTYQNRDAFISPDGRSLLIRVLGRQPPNDLEFCRAITAGVTRAADSANRDHLNIEYTGSYAIAARSEQAVRRDMIGSVVGSVLLLQILFLIAYRSPFKLFALAFGPVAIGVLFGFGLYALFSTGLTPLTGVLGAILAGMGIDYSIQYLSLYESRRGSGSTARQAAAQSAVEMGPAVVAAWATSVIGFIAIGCSRVRALRDFAFLGTLGLTGAFICAVAALPALLMLSDRRPTPIARSRNRFGAGQFLRSLGKHRVRWIGLSFLMLAAGAIIVGRYGGRVLPMETDLTVMHPRPNPAIDAQYHIAKRFGISVGSLAVYLHAATPGRLVSLAYDVNARLKGQAARAAGVSGTYGLATLLPDPRMIPARRAAVSEDEAARVVADFRSALSENGFSPEPFEGYAQFLHALLTQKSAPTVHDLLGYRRMAETVLPASAFRGTPTVEAITLVFVSKPLDQDRASRDEAIVAIRDALHGLDGATLTGLGVVGHDAEATVRRDLPRLALAAIGLAAVYLILHFRNLANALLSLVPAVFGMIVAAAVLRLAGEKLNMINLIAIPLLIGIDVDYGIFLVSLTRPRRAPQMPAVPAVDLVRRIQPVCHAVIICATATTLGYVSLIWTSVPAERSLGVTAAVGVGACLAGALFLLVPILFSVSRPLQPKS
jgi:uncharacterized protein